MTGFRTKLYHYTRPRYLVWLALPLLFPVALIVLATLDTLRTKQETNFKFGMTVATLRQKRAVLEAMEPNFKPVPNPQIPLIAMHLDKQKIKALNANLPFSGYQEQSAQIETNAGFLNIKTRLRGDNPWHWHFPKKSWRLTASKHRPFAQGVSVEMINPRTSCYLVDYTNIVVAKTGFDLLSPSIRMTALILNGRYQGVYNCQTPFDDIWTLNEGLMPGNFFEGDPSATRGRVGNYATNAYKWRQSSSTSDEIAAASKERQRQLLRQINEHTYWTKPSRQPLLDEDYMIRFLAYIAMTSSMHYDNFHNMLMYHDPLSGQFRFIASDTVGLFLHDPQANQVDLDLASNRIFAELLRNPRFTERKNQYLYEKVNDEDLFKGIVQTVWSQALALEPYIFGDKLDDQGTNWTGFAGRKEFKNLTINLLHGFFPKRREFLRKCLNDAQLRYAFLEKEGLLKIDADGYAPSRNIRIKFDRPVPQDLRIYRDMDLNGVFDPQRDSELSFSRGPDQSIYLDGLTLYPGRNGVLCGPHYLAPDAWYYMPSPLSYVFHLRTAHPSADSPVSIASLEAINSITDQKVREIAATEDWTMPTGLTLHPWSLPEEKTKAPEKYLRVQAGKPRLVKGNWFIPVGTTLEFAPGAELRMAPGVSIISQGRLIARGTAERPIRFLPMQSDSPTSETEPWGVIALQGKGAGESIFQHTTFEGGNQTLWESISYSAAVNAHYAPNVRFENCVFRGIPSAHRSANLLRCAKTQNIMIADCLFENARQNALVLDFAEGEIRGCRFSNAGNDAIDLSESSPLIANTEISGGTFNKGISAGDNSAPLIFNTLIRDARVGLEVKDASRPLVAHCDIQGLRIGIDQYAKNWRYGEGARAQVWNSLIASPTGRALQCDDKSRLQAYHSLLSEPPRETSPDQKTSASLELLFPHTYFEQCLLEPSNADAQEGVVTRPPPATTPGLWTNVPEAKSIGLIPAHNPALPAPIAQAPQVLFADRFLEDFTTSVAPWAPGGEFGRLAKNYRHLEAAAKKSPKGTLAWIWRPIPALPGTGSAEAATPRYLVIEARSQANEENPAQASSAQITVKFHGETKIASANKISFGAQAVERRSVKLPPGNIQRVSINFPSDGTPIELHRVELLQASSPLLP